VPPRLLAFTDAVAAPHRPHHLFAVCRGRAAFNPDWELAVEMDHPLPTFQNANFGCNASLLGSAFAMTKVPAFISLQDCIGTVWDYSPVHKGLQTNWKEAMAAQLGSALPLFKSGAVVGVFLGDEIMCSKIPFSNYSAVATATRKWLTDSGVPGALIYSNECSTPLTKRGQTWSIPDKLPAELDLFSIDLYAARESHSNPSSDPQKELEEVQKMVADHMRPRLHPHQRLMLVPGLFGDRNTTRSGTMEQQEEYLLAKLNATVAYAESQPDIVGVIPWHWLSPPKSYAIYSTIFGLGIESFPKLIARLNELKIKTDDDDAPGDYHHFGGGLFSTVQDMISKLPLLKIQPPIFNATKLVRTVKLSGEYKADVPLVLPSYTRLLLSQGTTVTAVDGLGPPPGGGPRGRLETALVIAGAQHYDPIKRAWVGEDTQMVGVEGGHWSCKELTATNVSAISGIWFVGVIGGWIENVVIDSCGHGYQSGPTPNYVTGNIQIVNGWGNSIHAVESTGSPRGVWAQTVKLVVWHGHFHRNSGDGLDFDSGSSKCVAYDNVCENNHRHGVFLEEGASSNLVINNTLLSNHGFGVCEGSAEAGPTHDNLLLANILGPNHYNGTGGGGSLAVGGGGWQHRSNDFMAVGNEFTTGVATHGGILRGLVSLNDQQNKEPVTFSSDRMMANGSVYFWNPTQNTVAVDHDREQYSHFGGGLISVIMRDIVGKLPVAPAPGGPVKNGTALVRTVHLSGDYHADVVLKLPPYTRLVLNGSLRATPGLNAANGAGTDGRTGFGQLGTGMVYGSGDMIGVEGGYFDCSGWNSSQTDPNNGTSTLAGILFNDVFGGWIRGSTLTNCGCSSSGGTRPGYVSGNIWVRQGWGNSIQGVESGHSCNRGVWYDSTTCVV
jgi:parallel beta-helix repeat protein